MVYFHSKSKRTAILNRITTTGGDYQEQNTLQTGNASKQPCLENIKDCLNTENILNTTEIFKMLS